MPRTIAVVGSGPSGCYLTQFLHRKLPDAEITVFERLPTPYGLLRYGVAPDHQGTKAVIEQFDRLFTQNSVRFAGNVHVGVDLSLQEVRDAFDAVVLATGIASDRRLHIPGETLPGVFGAGRITRLINSHPDEDPEMFELGDRTLIVGNGNVAADVLRMLIKTDADLLNSDVDDDVHNRMTHALTEIHMVGRSPAYAAKFDRALLRELAKVQGVRFHAHGLTEVDASTDPDGVAKVEDLHMLEHLEFDGPTRINVHFYFGWMPESIEGDTRVRAMTFRPAHGGEERLTVETRSVITAVGFSEGDQDTFVRADFLDNSSDTTHGILGAGLYCTGWFGKGASGTIPEHRTESRSVASAIVDDLSLMPVNPRKQGFTGLPGHVVNKSVDFAGWKAIDRTEIERAVAGRYRRKLRDRAEMLAIASDTVIRPFEERVS